MIQAIIFDVDGTLINSAEAVLASLRRLVHEGLGREVPEQRLRQYLGWPTVQTVVDLGFTDIPAAVRMWDDFYSQARHLRGPFPGIRELLPELRRRGVRLGTVTAMVRAEYVAGFLPYGLDPWLDVSVCADETPRPKPAADPLLAALARLEVAPGAALYVGDTAVDWQCARAAGVPFALVRYGPVQESGVAAAICLDSPEQLLTLV